MAQGNNHQNEETDYTVCVMVVVVSILPILLIPSLMYSWQSFCFSYSINYEKLNTKKNQIRYSVCGLIKWRVFSKYILTVNKYLKKYSTSLVLREMKIQTVGLQYQAWIPSYWASLPSNWTAIGYDHDICATTAPSQSSYCAGQCCGLRSSQLRRTVNCLPPEQKGLNITFWHHKS